MRVVNTLIDAYFMSMRSELDGSKTNKSLVAGSGGITFAGASETTAEKDERMREYRNTVDAM